MVPVVIIASNQLPHEQRAWVCPLSHDALPELGKYQQEKSVRYHCAIKHKRTKKKTLKDSGTARSKMYSKDCTAQPAWKAGKIILRKLNTEKAAAKRDEKKGHQDVFITPNCTVMKHKLKPGARLPTCRRCWLTATQRLHFKEVVANRLQEIIVLAEPGGKGCVTANPVLLMPSSKPGIQQLNMQMLSSSMQPKID